MIILLEEFDKYVWNYDMNNEAIKSKYHHSYRVMGLSKKYAKMLHFDKEDIELAGIIGLLHDFGRFEQFRRYRSFNDRETMDHADYSVYELFDKNKIVRFTNRVDDYELIRFAILNHNKLLIPQIADERFLKHARLIRDIDKVDIIYYLGYLGEHHYRANGERLSEGVICDIRNHRMVDRRHVCNNNDSLAVQFGFAFDIYYDSCLLEMKKNLKYYYEQIGGEDIFKEVYDEVVGYIDDRLKSREIGL